VASTASKIREAEFNQTSACVFPKNWAELWRREMGRVCWFMRSEFKRFFETIWVGKWGDKNLPFTPPEGGALKRNN
jgi:hypothetical protein